MDTMNAVSKDGLASKPIDENSQTAYKKKHPDWIKVRAPGGVAYEKMAKMVHEQKLHTVCESAACPNIGECWSNRALTIMILGNICTRSCGFCDVKTGRPSVVDEKEPLRVADVLSKLNLSHTVITSVDRDDLKDGGASLWWKTITEVKKSCPFMTLEVLVPDFKGVDKDIDTVCMALPHIFAHNIETVPRLSKTVRPQARYERSLYVLERAKHNKMATKSGLMLGLGETIEEVIDVLKDLRSVHCDGITLGQYLRPSEKHLPVVTYHNIDVFDELKIIANDLGFKHIESAPLVRSSYHADRQAKLLSQNESQNVYVV